MKTFEIFMAVGWLAVGIFHVVTQLPVSWWGILFMCVALSIKHLESAIRD
jgi:hypothetical protein